MWVLWIVIMVLRWPLPTTNATTSSIAKPGCNETCGSVSVPYPYGIGNDHCALNNHFLLICNDTHYSPPQLFFGENIRVLNISVEEGTVLANIDAAYSCYNSAGGLYEDFEQELTLGSGPFRFSDTRNKLTAYGCDTLAYMTDENESFGIACGSICSNVSELSMVTSNGSCSGIGCCQTSLPKSLKSLKISVASVFNHTKNLSKYYPCDYALLGNENTFNVSDLWHSLGTDNETVKSNVTIEWVVKEETCHEAIANSSYYACGDNASCYYSENGQGYRCSCNDGFRGNPYLLQGCQDINECEEGYRCEGTCKNTIGNYTCSCPLGMTGDGKTSCRGFRITTIAAVIGAIVFILTVGALAFFACNERRKHRNFSRNGGEILKHQRVRIFSQAELAKATKNYATCQFLGEGGFGSVYKGVLTDNTQVAVKKAKGVDKTRMKQEFQHEIGIVSQVNHKNVVKLLGLCLQTKVPLLVYEFISNGTLFQHIHDKSSQVLKAWKNRLRIAAETALALDYFHSLADPPIIHGDVKSANILLDENYTAKVSDFGTSVLISPGQNIMVTKVQGTFGYLDPEYLITGILTEKSDVYSFGVVLVELLTGVKPGSRPASGEKISIIQYFIMAIENNSLFQILDFEVADEDEKEEIEVVAELAKRCLSGSGTKRPTMREVAEELDKQNRLHEKLWAQQNNNEETEHLLGESSFSNLHRPTPVIAQPDAHTVMSLEIENYSDSI